MTQEELLQKIDTWYDEGNHQTIVDAIERVPQEERSYELTGQYAVALNNTNRYEEALQTLDSIQEKGSSDGAWHYRRGYALYMLDLEAEAAEALRQAVALGRNDNYILELLSECEAGAATREQKEEQLQTRFRERKLPDSAREPFEGFDFSDFWDDCDYALKEYVSDPFSDELVKELETELGFLLPKSYLWLMKRHNGGIPAKDCHPALPTSWAEDHIAISGIMGIGREKSNSLGGQFGSRFWHEEWGYPDIGVAICDCPSAGHDMVYLDYSLCGPNGEPMVVHVDQEHDYEITWLADDFESFIRGLVSEENYEDEDYLLE